MLRGKRAKSMPGTRLLPFYLQVPEYRGWAGCFTDQVEGPGVFTGKLWLPEDTHPPAKRRLAGEPQAGIPTLQAGRAYDAD